MIYLDHAATSPVQPEVLNQMLPWLQPDHVGNPSSIHTQGIQARRAIEEARRQVARMINADPQEVYFTSGGTESNNSWIRNLDRHIILTTKVEHHSIIEPIENGVVSAAYIRPVYVGVDSFGAIDLGDLKTKLDCFKGVTGAVSVMWVNNELGTINPIKEIGSICRSYNVPLHVDAIQAAGHIPIDVKDCHIDMLSLSGHKFGAPTGVGALYVRRDITKKPMLYGGGQEHGVRGGTENIPGIIGIGAAAKLVNDNIDTWRFEWRMLRRAFIEDLTKYMGDDPFIINGGNNVSHNIISLTIPGVHGESLMILLDAEGVCVSAGAACSSGSPNPSHVLLGVGISEELAESTIRVSMGIGTTAEEMNIAAKTIADSVRRLKAM